MHFETDEPLWRKLALKQLLVVNLKKKTLFHTIDIFNIKLHDCLSYDTIDLSEQQMNLVGYM